MKPKNDYIEVEPVKIGVLHSDTGNYYQIVNMSDKVDVLGEYKIGDLILIESDLVIKVTKNGDPKYYVNHNNVLSGDNDDSQLGDPST